MRFGPSDRTAGVPTRVMPASKPTKGILMHARMLAIPLLAAAGALPALAAPASADTIASTSAAVSANASSAATLDCGTILGFGGPFGPQPVGAVCVSIGNGQVSGYDGVFPGGTTDLSTWITQCNATQTVCSIVPGTEVFSPVTPTAPTTPGEFYEACTSFIVTNAGNQIIAGGCSPLVAA